MFKGDLHKQFGLWPNSVRSMRSGGEPSAAYVFARYAVAAREVETLLPFPLISLYETAALLSGGDVALALIEVQRLRDLCGDNPRYHLLALRSQAVLAAWEGDPVITAHWAMALPWLKRLVTPSPQVDLQNLPLTRLAAAQPRYHSGQKSPAPLPYRAGRQPAGRRDR